MRLQLTFVFFAAIIGAISGCGTPTKAPAPSIYNRATPSYVSGKSTSFESTPLTETTLEVEDEYSGFATERDNAEVNYQISAALRVYEDSKRAADLFSVKTKTPVNCDNTAMEATMQSIQGIERTADKFNQRVISETILSEREAAMDVADELNAMVLDSYFEMARGYRTAKCYSRAQFLLEEILRIYTGDSFEAWRVDAETELKAITSEVPPTNNKVLKKLSPSTKKLSRKSL